MKHVVYQNKEFVYDSEHVRLSSILSGNVTEALANVDHYEADTNMAIPTEEAVELAKAWVDENQK